jgi:hypothetical protein
MDIGLTVVIVLVALAVVALLAAQARHRRRAAAELIDPDRSTRDPGPGARPDELWTGVDRSGGGWHGPSASGGFPAVDPASREPQVPAQRTGEHDRDQPEPAEHEHSGPVRRLLRRRG